MLVLCDATCVENKKYIYGRSTFEIEMNTYRLHTQIKAIRWEKTQDGFSNII